MIFAVEMAARFAFLHRSKSSKEIGRNKNKPKRKRPSLAGERQNIGERKSEKKKIIKKQNIRPSISQAHVVFTFNRSYFQSLEISEKHKITAATAATATTIAAATTT